MGVESNLRTRACSKPVGGVTSYHILISGWVQGVGFRWFAQRLASSLGIVGWVRNCPDGRVEVLAQAEKEVLDAFCERLREGPGYGQTEELSIDVVPVDPRLRSFQIRS